MTDPLINQVLGRHRILHEITKGAMGKIYFAQHIHTNKKVALKTIRTDLLADLDEHAQREIEERFRREAQTAAQISHGNVVEIYDFETAQENLPAYIAMEFLEGESLSSILKRETKLSLERSIELMIQICRGVGNAHEKGFVRRDLKPANIVILPPKNNEETERVKIVDFGLVKIFDTDLTKLTKDGKILGTPEFMSPEQCNSEDIDSNSDVYSLGLIFYLMLCGEMPYYGDDLSQWLICHIRKQPKSLSDDIPTEIAQIVMQSLQKRREQRPKSAIELRDRLVEIRKQKQEHLYKLERQQVEDELKNDFEQKLLVINRKNKEEVGKIDRQVKEITEANAQLSKSVSEKSFKSPI